MKRAHQQANGDQTRPLPAWRKAQERSEQQKQKSETQRHEKKGREMLHATRAGDEITSPGEADQHDQAHIPGWHCVVRHIFTV